MNKLNSVELAKIRLPMRKTFSHNLANHRQTDNLILIVDDMNCHGVGEAIPRSYVTCEDSDNVFNNFENSKAVRILKDFRYSNLNDGVKKIVNLKTNNKQSENFIGPAMSCLVELSLLDFLGKKYEVSLHEIIQNILNNSISIKKSLTNYPFTTVISYDDSLESKLLNVDKVHAVKLKVGKDMDHDLDTLSKIRSIIGDNVPLFIDGNRCWSYEEGVEFVKKSRNLNILWMEEPIDTSDYKELASFRKETGAKLMLDENCICLEDLIKAHELRAFDYINLRISKNGGIFHLIEMYKFIIENGYKAQLGVQVGEIGPLWAAGRKLMQSGLNVSAYEAGQIDLLLGKYDLLTEYKIDRSYNHAAPMSKSGLGLDKIRAYVDQNKQESINITI